MKVRKIKDDSLVDPYSELQMNLEQIEKEGNHFMLKEIYEQPSVIKDTYRGGLHANEGIIQMSGVEDNLEILKCRQNYYSCMWYIMGMLD
jgi:glucosamine--fructose-6-phosphate aminotransferase (isomerizing)